MAVVIPMVMPLVVTNLDTDRADMDADTCGVRGTGHQAQGNDRRDNGRK